MGKNKKPALEMAAEVLVIWVIIAADLSIKWKYLGILYDNTPNASCSTKIASISNSNIYG